MLAARLGQGPVLLSAEDGSELQAFPWKDAYGCLTLGASPDGALAAVADEAGTVRFIDLPWGRPIPFPS